MTTFSTVALCEIVTVVDLTNPDWQWLNKTRFNNPRSFHPITPHLLQGTYVAGVAVNKVLDVHQWFGTYAI